MTVRFAGAATPGNTDPGINANAQGQKVTSNDNPTGQSTIVTIDPARNSGDNGYAFTIAHEGSHVADVANLARALPTDLTSPQATAIISGAMPFIGALQLNKWATEMRAYQTEAFAGQALLPNQSLSVGGNTTYQIWNPQWAEADRATNRARGIFNVLTQPRSQGGVYALNPFVGNMGPKLLH